LQRRCKTSQRHCEICYDVAKDVDASTKIATPLQTSQRPCEICYSIPKDVDASTKIAKA
jgi:hypothetical protein